MWAFAKIFVSGQESRVYLPNNYFGSNEDSVTDALRLGRETAWDEESGIAMGRRIFAANDESEFCLFDLVDCTIRSSSSE